MQVLEVLRSGPGSLTVVDVADRVGLHPNTVRMHLDQLVSAGLVTRERQLRDGPGRPRLVYDATRSSGTASDHPIGDDDGYRLLAEILAGRLEDTSAHAAAEATDAGRSWGHALSVRSEAASGPVSAAHASEALTKMLDALGFAPLAIAGSDTLELHRCPFRQVAEKHSAVVCGVHLGLMQGALDQMDAPVQAVGLEPFVEPGLCLTRLSPRTGDGVSGRSIA